MISIHVIQLVYSLATEQIYCLIIAPQAARNSFFLTFVLSPHKTRRKQAVEDLAVKPVTQFPVEISNEDAFASFKNVRHVTIKKVIDG